MHGVRGAIRSRVRLRLNANSSVVAWRLGPKRDALTVKMYECECVRPHAVMHENVANRRLRALVCMGAGWM